MVEHLREMAGHATITGELADGAPAMVARFNSCLARLGAIALPLFAPLADDASVETIGVESGLLAEYLKEEAEPSPGAPEAQDEPSISINMGPVIDLGGGRVSEMIRGLPDMIRSLWAREATERTRASGGEGEQQHGETCEADSVPATLSDVESRLVEVGAKLQAVAEQLRRGDLDDEQRAVLAEQLSQLGREQALLARRHAALREAE